MEDARTLAVTAHPGQLYDSEPYETHLAAVVRVLRDFGSGEGNQNTGWLHDIVEDAAVPLAERRARCGDQTAGMVDAVTGMGTTRHERIACTYAGLRACPSAAAVKLADRIANVEGAAPGSEHRARYTREAAAFAEVVRPHVPALTGGLPAITVRNAPRRMPTCWSW